MISQAAEPLVVVCGGDDNFAMPMAVMLFSVLSHLRTGLEVQLFVLDNGLTDKSKTRLESVLRQPALPSRQITITYLHPDTTALGDLKTNHWLNMNAYLRLTIPRLLPETCDKVLYMDGDMIAEKDIAPLWEKEMGDNSILSVIDYGIGFAASPIGLLETYAEVGLPPETPYFNSGLMVINLKQWRESHLIEKVIDYTVRYKDYVRFADQDGLNAVIAGNWGQFDLRWNVQVGAVRAFDTWPESPHKEKMRPHIKTLIDEAYIIHFTGGRKPWIGGLTSPIRPRFDRYLKQSGWFTTRGEYRAWRQAWFRHCIKLIAGDVRKKLSR